MRMIQTITDKLLCLLALLAGLAAAVWHTQFAQPYVEKALAYCNGLSEENAQVALFMGGILLAILGLFALLPRWKPRGAHRMIVFEGENGTNRVDLESIQKALVQDVGRLAPVKKIHELSLTPIRGNTEVIVDARIDLAKQSSMGARDTAEHANKLIKARAARRLGAEIIRRVNLNIGEIVVDDASPGMVMDDEELETTPEIEAGRAAAPAQTEVSPPPPPAPAPSSAAAAAQPARSYGLDLGFDETSNGAGVIQEGFGRPVSDYAEPMILADEEEEEEEEGK